MDAFYVDWHGKESASGSNSRETLETGMMEDGKSGGLGAPPSSQLILPLQTSAGLLGTPGSVKAGSINHRCLSAATNLRCLSVVGDTRINFPSTDTLPKKKNGKKHDAPSKLDERKDATKDNTKNYAPAVIGLLLGLFSFATMFWIILSQELYIFWILVGAAGLVSAFLCMGFSLLSLSYIKKHSDKYDGKLLAKGGIILSGIYLIVALIFFIWNYPSGTASLKGVQGKP